jgi:hypothetical protein
MSYARWSNSAWYAFYNVNGCLSLWYDMDHTFDICYDDALEITKEDILRNYSCTEREADEAMTYVKYFIEDYEPEAKEEYERELKEFMDKLEALDKGESDA